MDQGTTVKIYFPRLRANTPDEIVDVHQPVVGAEEAETILVVEDDSDVRAYLADVLRGLDYHVVTAPNAEAALDLLRSDKPVDLLLTDIIMPGWNGRDLSNQAERLRPGLRVLFMTGYSRNAVVHQGRLDEGVDLLQKPVSQAQLAMRVRAALDRKESK